MALVVEASLKESLKSLIVRAVEPTNEKPESGIYGDAVVIKVSGLVCAAKKIDVTSILREGEEQEAEAKSYAEDCKRTRELQHPNLVHFLGVLAAGPGAPLLVTELLPMSLASFIGKYPRIPNHLKYSILFDVAMGLRFLHEQSPPVVHGCLSADSVMLNDSLRAKLTGHLALGSFAARQSEYTPPEITSRSEKAVELQSDCFSFGNLLLHVTLQRKPSLLLSKKQRPNPSNPDEVISLSEIQRREVFLREVGEGTWIYDLATKCLEDDPASRPTVIDILSTLGKVCAENSPPYGSFMELLSAADKLSEANESISSLNTIIEAKQEEIQACVEQQEAIEKGLEAKDLELSAVKLELQTQKQALENKHKLLHAHEQALRAKDALVKAKDRELAAKKKEINTKDTMLRSANKRAKILEQHITQKKTSGSPPALSPRDPAKSQSFLNTIQEPGTATAAEAEDIVVRRAVRGRFQKANTISSDGLVYQDWQRSLKDQADTTRKMDPKLASIFAKRQQHIEASQALQEASNGGSPPGSRRPPEVPERRRSQSMGGKERFPPMSKDEEKHTNTDNVSQQP